jgi:arylsulfatase
MLAAQAIAGEFIATFKDFPPRQKPQSFSLDQVMQRLQKPAND